MSPRIATRHLLKNTTVRVQRTLSMSGEILVRPGQPVQPDHIIGQTALPSEFVVLDVAASFGIPDLDLNRVMLKWENEAVEEGEIIAQLERRFPFKTKTLKSPVTGVIAALSGRHVLIETEARLEKLKALVGGLVTSVDHTRGVTIETRGLYFEGACGLGGSNYGVLKLLSDDRTADMNGEAFALLDRHAVFVAGGSIDELTLRRANALGVAGLIVGSINAELLKIDPLPDIPIIATEGFGNRLMAPKTFEFLQDHADQDVSLLQGQPIPSALFTKRPQIIIPNLLADEIVVSSTLETPPTGQPVTRSWVRALRGDEAGSWGQISAMSASPAATDADIRYFGAEVLFAHGTQFVPWYNLEHLS